MKEIVIKNEISEINRVIDFVVSYCHEQHFSDDVCFDVQLAVEEAVTNIIKYGYQDQEKHSVLVRAWSEDREIVVEIVDDARAFNPLEAAEPDLSIPIEERPIGGLGIYLLRRVMDQLEYKREGSKNILRMVKHTSR